MDININLALLAIIGFLILSAFFSGSETAFFSLTKIQLKKMEKSGTKSSRRIVRLMKNPRELLIIILLGNTIVNVAASSLAALIAIKISREFLSVSSEFYVLTAEIFLMTILLLIFGELTPKLYAYSSPEKLALFSSFLLIIIRFLLWPVIKILGLISAVFSRKHTTSEYTAITSEDFKNLITSDSSQHYLEENEKKIITSIFRFSSTSAREILIPRVDMVAVEASEGLSKLKEVIQQSGHSKIPVFKKNIDNIIGIVYAKDIILNPDKKAIPSFLRPAIFVTENIKIQNLLNQFRIKKIQIAIVVDEYGGTSGLITLEDILEELVGEIHDEYDQESPLISQQMDDEYIVSGMYSIAQLNQEFYLDIDEEAYDNLADFLFDSFNRVPQKNDSYIYNNRVKFTVTNISSQRIKFVKMKLLPVVEDEFE